MLGRGYDMDESQFAAAIAASAHAIYSLDQARKEEIVFRPTQQQDSIMKPSRKDTRTRRAISSFAEHQRQRENSRGNRNFNDATDAWERAQMAKIRKRYEKLSSEIVAWENEKKVKEKHRMERRKSELELRKSRNLKHYQSKIARIDHIADGARAQVDEKRKQEEFIVKEKARKFRSTGKIHVKYCFCL